MSAQSHTAGHLAALLTVTIWGTTFVSTKVLLQDFEPVEILFIRFVVGFMVLWLAHPKALKLTDKRQEIYFVAAGLCGICLYYLLENIALTFTTASNVGVIVAVTPIFTAILARLCFGADSALKPQFVIGFILAMTGISLISFGGDTHLSVDVKGDLLAVGAALVWACYSCLTRKIGTFGYPVIACTRHTFFYGILFMIPALWIFGFDTDITRIFKLKNLLNLLFLGLGASALCFVTWNFAVKALGVVRTAAYIYLSPVITVVMSVWILSEPFTGVLVCGTTLTLAGLFLSEYRGRKLTCSESKE